MPGVKAEAVAPKAPVKQAGDKREGANKSKTTVTRTKLFGRPK